MKEYNWTMNGREIPMAGLLCARRLSDNKESLAISADNEGVYVMENGEKILLKYGNFELFRK